MTIMQSFLLGLLQGVAEFLPISSSGHLILAQRLFNLKDVPLLFDVVLHVATLLAVVLFFKTRLAELLKAFLRWAANRPMTDIKGTSPLTATDEDARRTVEAVIFATIATGGVGVIVEKAVKDVNPAVVCIMFLVTAAILVLSAFIVKRRQTDGRSSALLVSSPTLRMSMFIGIAQGIGTMPGISRSGITISAALLCGLKAEAAGELSFIVSIPAILGAFILQMKDAPKLAGLGVLPLAIGALTAFVSGYLALVLLMRIIKRGRLAWFAVYLTAAAAAGLIWLH